MEALHQQLRQVLRKIVGQSEHVGRFWVLKGVDLSLFKSLTGHYDTDCTKKQSPAMYTHETPTQSQRYIEMPLGQLARFRDTGEDPGAGTCRIQNGAGFIVIGPVGMTHCTKTIKGDTTQSLKVEVCLARLSVEGLFSFPTNLKAHCKKKGWVLNLLALFVKGWHDRLDAAPVSSAAAARGSLELGEWMSEYPCPALPPKKRRRGPNESAATRQHAELLKEVKKLEARWQPDALVLLAEGPRVHTHVHVDHHCSACPQDYEPHLSGLRYTCDMCNLDFCERHHLQHEEGHDLTLVRLSKKPATEEEVKHWPIQRVLIFQRERLFVCWVGCWKDSWIPRSSDNEAAIPTKQRYPRNSNNLLL